MKKSENFRRGPLRNSKNANWQALKLQILGFVFVFISGFCVGTFYEDEGSTKNPSLVSAGPDDFLVESCFSPAGNCINLICSHIDSAKDEILVQAYSFTSKKIAESLLRAKGRGL